MIKTISKKEYTDFWKKHNGSCMQSWAWGDFKSYAWKVKRLGILIDEKLISVVSVHIRKLPFSSVLKLLGLNSFAYIPRGLVVNNVSNIGKALEELDDYLKAEKLAFILIDPENNIFIENWNEEFKKALKNSGWQKEGTTIQPNQTDIIKIDKSDEELFKSFRAKWRRNVNKAKRHGIEAYEVEDNTAVDKFYKVISDVAKRTDFICKDISYFQRMWDTLSKDDQIKVFIAEKDNEVLATYLVLVSENVAYEIFGGSTLKGRDMEASFLLKWKIIRKMRDEGKIYYDQWGVAPKEAKNHPLKGISYFKNGFGGKYIEFLPQYKKVFSKLGYRFIKLFF